MRDFVAVFAQDLAAQTPPLTGWRIIDGLKHPVLNWQRRLRRLEELDRKKQVLNPLQKAWFFILRRIHNRDSIRLGLYIPLHTFGPGLSMAHWGPITVAGGARIGSHCRVHQGVTIGVSKGKIPQIGNGCFLGANSCVIGGVVLGDNVTVGAGAVVVKSFGSNVVVGGVPAREIRAKPR